MQSNAQTLPSSQRPVPLSARKDIVVEMVRFEGMPYAIVKDPVELKYFRLRPDQYLLLQLLDSRRSLEDLRSALCDEFPTAGYQLADVQQLVVDLHEKGLAFSTRPGQARGFVRRERNLENKRWFRALTNLLSIRLPGWNPDAFLTKMYPKIRWVFQPRTVVASTCLVLSAWTLLAIRFDQLQQRLPEFHQFFGWPNLMYLMAILAGVKLLHEFGHAFLCKHYGRECNEIGVLLLVFSPTMYCDTTDAWMLRNKWQRIAIGAAGIYVELVLSAIAIFVWWNTQPGLWNHLCLNVFFVTTASTIIFNANPLMRFDGYYMLSDLLEIPNLSQKANKLLGDFFARHCLGIHARPDPFMPESRQFWFISYAIAAAIYRWFVLFGIVLFLYVVLKPYGLESIGITIAWFSLCSIAANMGMRVYRIITAPRAEPMSVLRMTATAIAVSLVIGGFLVLPIPIFNQAAFTIEPHGIRDVYATAPGRIAEVLCRPGDRVEAGDLLVRLSNVELEDQYRALTVQKELAQVDISMHHALDDTGSQRLAEVRLQALEAELADSQQQIARLKITAPAAGIVIAAPNVERPTFEESKERLGGLYGTPLDTHNMNAYVSESTHLLSIAPEESHQATLLIDQGTRDDIELQHRVRLKLNHLPDHVYEGRVEEIAIRQLDYAPQALSNKSGGDLPTVTDAEGRERLASVAYQAIVRLDADTSLFRPGMRGTARFFVTPRTGGEWMWRLIRHTLRFRL